MGNAAELIEESVQPERIVIASDNFGMSAIAYSATQSGKVISAESAEEAFYAFMHHRFPELELLPPKQLLASALRGDLGLSVELQNLSDFR